VNQPDANAEPNLEVPSVDPNDPDNQKYKKKPSELPSLYSLVILLYCLAVYYLVYYADHRLPTALTTLDAQRYPGHFIEERSRVFLKRLTSVGARPAGSYENEILAVDLLKQEIEAIKRVAKPTHKLSLDIQKPRGSFNLDFIDGLTHHYRNIQNVIVKLESEGSLQDALLINCHFDSVPLSPGP
jgi:hypothetical protein